MKNPLLNFALAALLALGLEACTAFGPERDPPHMPSPEHYAAQVQATTLPSADEVAQHLAVGARPVPQWWEAYQSEELNALVADPEVGRAMRDLFASDLLKAAPVRREEWRRRPLTARLAETVATLFAARL